MASSRNSSPQATSKAAAATLAKALAPEEICTGQYVTPLHVVAEIPSWYWDQCQFDNPRHEPVRMRLLTGCDGAPLRVESICLPFVLVKQPGGRAVTLDLRRCQVARLDAAYARRPWKAYKKQFAVCRAEEGCGR